MEGESTTTAERRELDRVGAFSDGVFAIAITLLVLNIEVPHVPAGDLGHAISDLADDLEAYAIGFAVMGMFWYGHHKLFSRLRRSSGRLALVNMVFLAFIALMPFTTAVLGGYNTALAVTLYALNVGVALLLDGLTEAVAVGQGLYEDPAIAPPNAVESLLQGALRAAVFFASIPVAYFVSESLAKWFWLLLIVVRIVLRRRNEAARARSRWA
jgi:uncharacterized membrane protein